MKKGIVTMKKVILSSVFMLCSINIFGQIKRGIDIDTMINNKYLKFKLRVDRERLVSLEVQNKTSDTLSVRAKLEIEQPKKLFYIAGYEKRDKDRKGRDSVYYQGGVLWHHCGCVTNDTAYIQLFGKSRKFLEKLPPQTKIIIPISYFSRGKYFFKIQTVYVYRKKTYFVRTETNKIKIE